MVARLLAPLLALAIGQGPPVTAPPGPAADLVPVEIRTSLGPITVALNRAHAPVTAANFLRYADGHRFDGSSFYRAMNVAPGYGLVQGGLRNDPRRLLPPIPLEPTSRTGLSHVAGTISMARAAPNSATADFFITVGDLPAFDADPSKPGDNAGFAAFGHVVAGMDVVTRILAEPTAAAGGPPGMSGQMLAAPVRILSVRRVDRAAPPAEGAGRQ